MGAATGIIGLGLQGVSMLQSPGTQYSPDPKAKYEADRMAIEQAKINLGKQQSLLEEQTKTANELAKYDFDNQALQYQKEYEYYQASVQNAYLQNQAEFERNQLLTDIETQNNAIRSDMNRKAIAHQYEQQLTDIERTKYENAVALDFSNREKQIDRNTLTSRYQTDLGQLGVQEKGLDLERAKTMLDANEIDRQFALARGDLSLQEGRLAGDKAQVDIAADQARAQSELQQGDFFTDVINTFTKSDRNLKGLVNQMQARGLLPGVGVGALEEAQFNNSELENALRQQQARYGDQIGSTEIARDLGLSQMGLAEADLMSKRAQLMGDERNAQQANRFQMVSNDLSRQGLNLNRNQTGKDYQSNLERLALAGESDLYRYSLLPDLRLLDQANRAKFAQSMGLSEADLDELLLRTNYDLSSMQNNRAIQSNEMARNTALETLQSDLARQNQANQAAYSSNLSTNQLEKAAVLSQLLQSQHGLLSGIGAGLNNPQPSGGGRGLNLEALSGFLSNAANVFGSMGGGVSNPGVTNRRPLQTQQTPFVRTTGNWTNQTMPNTLNRNLYSQPK